jgi:hypothetical protein
MDFRRRRGSREFAFRKVIVEGESLPQLYPVGTKTSAVRVEILGAKEKVLSRPPGSQHFSKNTTPSGERGRPVKTEIFTGQ